MVLWDVFIAKHPFFLFFHKELALASTLPYTSKQSYGTSDPHSGQKDISKSRTACHRAEESISASSLWGTFAPFTFCHSTLAGRRVFTQQDYRLRREKIARASPTEPGYSAKAVGFCRLKKDRACSISHCIAKAFQLFFFFFHKSAKVTLHFSQIWGCSL